MLRVFPRALYNRGKGSTTKGKSSAQHQSGDDMNSVHLLGLQNKATVLKAVETSLQDSNLSCLYLDLEADNILTPLFIVWELLCLLFLKYWLYHFTLHQQVTRTLVALHHCQCLLSVEIATILTNSGQYCVKVWFAIFSNDYKEAEHFFRSLLASDVLLGFWGLGLFLKACHVMIIIFFFCSISCNLEDTIKVVR